jgi:hypothetical protein
MMSATRAETVERYNRALRAIIELADLDAEEQWYPRHQVIQRHHAAMVEELAAARSRYLEGLHCVNISRCPISGEVLGRRIDVDGLDGPWWDDENPIRPVDEQPVTFVALCGAVRLGADITPAPFLTKPGPEAPFVVPELLAVDGVTAVISSLDIGPHLAYPITYWAHSLPDDTPRPNEWGASSYQLPNGRWGADDVFETAYDDELAPWIDANKLAWIAPDDTSLTVRTGRDGCPYVDLPGRRTVTRIHDGNVWWPETEAADHRHERREP